MGGRNPDNSIETVSGCVQVFYLADKDFKAAIINMFKKIWKAMFKEVKYDNNKWTHRYSTGCNKL